MEELWNTIVTQVREKAVGIVVGIVAGGIGWYIGFWRARAKWRRREFFDRVNFSLNTISDGKLLIRTIIEKAGEEVFLNKPATDALLSAAQKTTPDNPIIPLPKDDYWYYLNSVLNEISERFSHGHLKRDLGVEMVSERYLVCLTNECAGDIRTRKLRAMLIRKSLLQKLPEKRPEFESPNHSIRWETLLILAKEYAERPYQFLELEIVV